MNKITIRQLAASTLMWLGCLHRRGTGRLGRVRTRRAQQARIHRRAESAGPAVAADLASSAPACRAGCPSPSTIRRASRWTSPNTTLALPSRRIDVHANGVDSILAAEAKGRTRLVLNLDQAGALRHARRRATTSSCWLAPPARRRMAAAASAARRGSPSHSASAARAARARSAASTSVADPTAPAASSCSCPTRARRSTCASSATRSSSISPARTLPKNLARRYDATDFGTPVSGFDVAARRRRHAHRHQRHRRLRAARLPVRRPVRGRGAAGPQGRRAGRGQAASTRASA